VGCGADSEVADTALADGVDAADGSATDVAETRDVLIPDVDGDSNEADTRAETRDAAGDDTGEAPTDAEVDVDATERCPGEGEPCISAGVCGPGVLECGQAGAARCSSSPGGSDSVASEEVCDGLDNDCDGDTDEDFVSSASPSFKPLTGAANPDDDGKGKGAACGSGECIAGGSPGTVSCTADGRSLQCSSDGRAVAERCDGLDNDCDGVVDQGFDYRGAPLAAACDGEGACGAGIVVCAVGSTTVATCSTGADGPDSQASAERCDGVDNDCDGLTDEGMTYGGASVGSNCDGLGACGAGTVACAASGAATCSTNPDGASSQATPEVCDGADNDCDGVVDDNCESSCDPPCENQGTCVAADTCDCAGTGFSGSVCDEPVCVLSCLNGGTCAAPDTCSCGGTGYSGARCESPVCTQSCLNGGTCTAPNTCTCTGTGYTGARCETPVCTQSCLNGGVCSAPNTCDCVGTGYSGARCETPVCSPSCLNGGFCSAPNTCDCAGTGFTGSRCETPVCTPSCQHGGSCQGPNSCSCVGTGYTGSFCETPVCSPACENGGACVGPNVCDCADNFGGPTCADLVGYSRVPAGTFAMGSPTGEVGRNDDETKHNVTLTRAFWIKTTEVTQAEWQALMGNNPSSFSSCGGACPVERVNWFDAVAYVNALSAAQGLEACYTLSDCTGAAGDIDSFYECDTVSFVGLACTGYRLPTEAEWEYAARGGMSTATYNGNITQTGSGTEPVLEPIAWYVANAGGTPRAVGLKAPNAWALSDMLGNVAELVHDRYTGSYGTSYVVDPVDSYTVFPLGAGFIARGGAWLFDASHARAAWRIRMDPVRVNALGFRPVRTVP